MDSGIKYIHKNPKNQGSNEINIKWRKNGVEHDAW